MVQLREYVKDDKRYLYKDFGTLYLGNITHMAVNTYQKILPYDLLCMLFNIEELYENGKINYNEKEHMLEFAFCSYKRSGQYIPNKLYGLKSIVVQTPGIVLQATGCMCRTFVKNLDI